MFSLEIIKTGLLQIEQWMDMQIHNDQAELELVNSCVELSHGTAGAACLWEESKHRSEAGTNTYHSRQKRFSSRFNDNKKQVLLLRLRQKLEQARKMKYAYMLGTAH